MVKAIKPDNMEIAKEMRSLVLRMGRHLRTRAMSVGSSPMDAQLLTMLQMIPGIGVSDLAEIENMSKAAMSAHIKRLLDLGLVEKITPEEGVDRRRVGLRITPAAQTLIDDVNAKRTEWLRERLASLDDTDLRLLHEAAPILNKLHGPDLMQIFALNSTSEPNL